MRRLTAIALLLASCSSPLYAYYDTGFRWLIGTHYIYYGRESQSAGGYSQYVLIDYIYSNGEWRSRCDNRCGYAPWGFGGYIILTCFDWNGNVCNPSLHPDYDSYYVACAAQKYAESGLLLDLLNELYPGGGNVPDFNEVMGDITGDFILRGEGHAPYENPNGIPQGGDPVFLSNGEFTLSATDVSIPGRTLPVQITRTYGSRREYNGPFGYGWSINYNMKVRHLATPPGIPDVVVLLDAQGYRREYTQDGSDLNLYVRSENLDDYIYRTNGLFTLIDKSGIEHKFNAKGDLSMITDSNGGCITFAYDPVWRLLRSHSKYVVIGALHGTHYTATDQKRTTVVKDKPLYGIIDDLGRAIQFYYDANGLLTDINDFAGRNWHYTYDPVLNNLLSVRDPNGLTTQYTYDRGHNLLTVRDPNGQVYIANEYNRVEDKVAEQTYGYGAYVFDYNDVDRQAITTDREGYTTRTVYSADKQVLSETVYTADPDADPNSFTTYHRYDPNTLERTRTILPNGACVDYTYDDLANLTGVYRKTCVSDPNSRSDPNVFATTYTYDSTHIYEVNSITDPMGHTTYFEYDTDRNVTQITYPAIAVYGYAQPQNPIVQYTYNSHGQVDTMIAPDGIVTKYLYYSDANPTDPNCGKLWKTIVDYNAVDGLNITTEYAYDAYRNIREITDPNGDKTRNTYNELSLLTKTVSPLGKVTLFTYNPNKKVTRIEREIPGPNQVTSFTYDLLDHVKTTTNPLGYVTHYGYTKSEEPNLVTDAENHSTVSLYNERGLLAQVTDANDDPTTYTHTATGDMNDVQDARGNKTLYEYDGFGRLIYTIYPDTSYEAFTYDKNANLLSRTQRNGDVITYEYDAMNRLRVKSRPNEPNLVYAYDIAGRIYDVNDGGDITEYYYDRIGRIVDVNDPEDRLVSYEYDSRGLRTKLTYPDNSYITYEYDAEGKLRRISDDSNDLLAEYSYDDLGRRTLLTLGNDANVVYEYDLANRLTKLTNNLDDANSIVFAYDRYDKVGNRLSLQIDDTNEHVYSYDSVYRLTYVDYNDGNDMTFVYDALGNRHRTVNGGAVSYQTNSLNQYTAVGGTAHTYDDNGNLAYDGQFRYYYDCENRLLDVNDANDAPVASYAYDYAGRQISRTIYGTPNVTIRYAYDGSQIIAEYDGAGTLLRKFVYGPGIDEPICLIDVADANALYYYHRDGLGSVIALCDVNSAPVERYAYDVFGRPTIRDGNGTVIAESAFANPYLFTGRAYDTETALYYYRARYYDYYTGRFLQPDPIGYTDGLNLYAYVRNSPLAFKDPYGLWQVTLGGAYGLGGRITFGHNGGRWNVGFGFGYGLGGMVDVVRQDVQPGPASNGRAANVGFEVSTGFKVGGLDVSAGVRGRTEGDQAGILETRAGLIGGVTIPYTPINLSGSADVVAYGEFADLNQGRFDYWSELVGDPPSVGFGGMLFAGVTGGFSWGGSEAPEKK